MKLPNVEAYAAALPEGWSSFPQCGVRASLVVALRDRGVFDAVTGLPPEVERGIQSAGKTGAWYPEVLHVAGLLAVRDAQFPGPDGDAGYLAWMDHLNRELMTVPGQPGAFAAATTDAPRVRRGAREGGRRAAGRDVRRGDRRRSRARALPLELAARLRARHHPVRSRIGPVSSRAIRSW